jgi:hypothetical protein
MAQVDIMSAGRVRGRLGRGIEMFESGQLGGKGMQAAGARIGAMGGVGSALLGVSAAAGMAAIALVNMNSMSAQLAGTFAETANSARDIIRASKNAAADAAMKDAPNTRAGKVFLEKKGLLDISPEYQASAISLARRGMKPETIRTVIGKLENAELAGSGVATSEGLSAIEQIKGRVSALDAKSAMLRGARTLQRGGILERGREAQETFLSQTENAPIKGDMSAIQRAAQYTMKVGNEIGKISGERYPVLAKKGADRARAEAYQPGKAAMQDLAHALRMKAEALQAEAEATWQITRGFQTLLMPFTGNRPAHLRAADEFDRAQTVEDTFARESNSP